MDYIYILNPKTTLLHQHYSTLRFFSVWFLISAAPSAAAQSPRGVENKGPHPFKTQICTFIRLLKSEVLKHLFVLKNNNEK